MRDARRLFFFVFAPLRTLLASRERCEHLASVRNAWRGVFQPLGTQKRAFE